MKKLLATFLTLVASPAMAEVTRQSPITMAQELLLSDTVIKILGCLMAFTVLMVIYKAMRENGMLQEPSEVNPEELRQRPATFLVKSFCDHYIFILIALFFMGVIAFGMEFFQFMLRGG